MKLTRKDQFKKVLVNSETRKSHIKMSYRGQLRYIGCAMNTPYEDFLRIVIDVFNIQPRFRQGLIVSNKDGDIFDKQLFEYFILLFPKPEIVFYIHLDYSKIDNNDINWNNNQYLTAFNASSSDNNGQVKGTGGRLQAAPLCRQNCFLGALPTITAARRDCAPYIQIGGPGLMTRHESRQLLSNAANRRSIRL